MLSPFLTIVVSVLVAAAFYQGTKHGNEAIALSGERPSSYTDYGSRRAAHQRSALAYRIVGGMGLAFLILSVIIG